MGNIVLERERELIIDIAQEGKFEKWCAITTIDNIYETLYEFEVNNLRGISFTKLNEEEYHVKGFKGPEEKCYDSGRTVHYKGNCLAVLDDDNHFIFKNMRICEKTSSVYALSAYKNELEVSKPDQLLYERLSTNPVLFDCDTFQRDSKAVDEHISYGKEKAEISLIYKGPFRCIILSNGTIIRRGIPVSISNQSAELVGENNYIALNETSPLAKNYHDLYKKYGASFILRGESGINSYPQIRKVLSISENLKERLKNAIDHKNEYFILQGSDPADIDSCCPNPLVPELKQLINQGLMSSFGSPTAGGCPLTIYAFCDELSFTSDDFPDFTINERLRQAIRKYL